MEHKKVSQEELSKIIDKRKPLGTFYTIEEGYYVAVDNLTGDAWTEDFTNEKECMEYLDESTSCQIW